MSSIKHHVTGIEYWRGLGHLAESPEVAELVDKEFPGYDADTIAGTSRRGFMKLMGAAMALAGVGLSGCRRWPQEELTPYSANPRGIIPGVPEQYATAWELNGVANGLLVTSYDGRPIKIEGNPTHPSSATGKYGTAAYGSADAFAQASLLEMYDPERSQSVIDRTKVKDIKSLVGQEHTTWEAFMAAAKPMFAAYKGNTPAMDKDGKPAVDEDGQPVYAKPVFAVLSETSSSPSVLAQQKKFLAAYPGAKWYEYEPLSRDNEREGTLLAFERVQRPQYNVEKATVIVSLDCDLFGTHPNHTRFANDWAKHRRSADVEVEDASGKKTRLMNQMFCAESGLTITGASADVRLALKPERIYAIAYAIAAQLEPPAYAGVKAPETGTLVDPKAVNIDAREKGFVDSVVKALQAAGGSGFVAVGPSASPETHALAFLINIAVKAIGNTVTFIYEADTERKSHFKNIAKLTKELNAGAVTGVLILGGNPVYDAPADVDFAGALAKVSNSIHLSLYDNETSRAVKWHLPRAHYLECWGDGLAWDATVTLQQPIILPLWGGKSTIEVLAEFNGNETTEGYQIIRQTMSAPAAEDEAVVAFDKTFRKAIERGFAEKNTVQATDATPSRRGTDGVNRFPTFPAPSPAPAAGSFTLCFTPDSRVYDGRFANNGWLQETPDPLSKLMWENALLISVKDARDPKLNLDTGDMVELTVAGKKLTVPVLMLPGQPIGVLSLSLGYGRTASGSIGTELGFNSYSLRTSTSPWYVSGVQISKTGESYELATSAEHHLLSPMAMEAEEYRVGKKNENGKIIREMSREEYIDPNNAEDAGGKTRKVGLQLFYPPMGNQFTDVHAWGMAIDLAACIGCNACAVACQAENNIPVVGKEQCLRHREMNWIRIDRYFRGDPEESEPEVVFQPMACQHCENAPCEQVCPVAATVHDSEGLNTMVYNRCIGTRYCSNNCPYKVRRFNYFDFHSQDPRSDSKWMKKPWPNIPDLEQRDPEKYNEIKRMAFNPEVTVRMRGVMEKCTYCVQRIHLAVIGKRNQGNGVDIVDGDIITACQQACPTEAIVFGNLNDKTSKVSQLQWANARAYDVLQEDLNTRPRTRYLAKLRNPV